jgi:microcystin degradation protein MlrC
MVMAGDSTVRGLVTTHLRIAIGGLSHETNTYADAVSGPTGPDAFSIRRGERVLRARGTETFVGGFLDACEELGAEPVPTLWAWANPSGTIGAEAYAALRDELLQRLGHLAGAILTSDAPGLTTNLVHTFEHRRAGRPLWPQGL